MAHEFFDMTHHVLSKHSHGRPFQISFIGQGEPLINCDNIFSFCDKAVGHWPDVVFGISTIGIAEGIYALAACEWARRVKLQISIHALPKDKRLRIVRAEQDYPIQHAMEAAKHFATTTGRTVYLSYVPLHEVNDGEDDAELLADLAKAGPFCVKITEYNPSPESPYLPAKQEAMSAFCACLDKREVPYYCFRSIGAPYGIGCGQSRLTREYPKPSP